MIFFFQTAFSRDSNNFISTQPSRALFLWPYTAISGINQPRMYRGFSQCDKLEKCWWTTSSVAFPRKYFMCRTNCRDTWSFEFDEVFLIVETQKFRQINYLFSIFFSKNVTFTKFLSYTFYKHQNRFHVKSELQKNFEIVTLCIILRAFAKDQKIKCTTFHIVEIAFYFHDLQKFRQNNFVK